MTRKNKNIKNTLANRPESPRYDVGYRRPPQDTRFASGAIRQSQRQAEGLEKQANERRKPGLGISR